MSQRRLVATIRSDLPAAIVVFLVAVPLCLGIALASGAPLISGLIAGIVGGIVVGVLSESALGVAGPAAGLAVIVLTAIEDLGAFDVFLVAVVLAGLIQVALGFARAGIVAYYFPSTVIRGMLFGIGVIIVLKQLPHALGYDENPEGDLSFHQRDGETTFSELLNVMDHVSPGPLLIASVSLAILVLWETRWLKQYKFLTLAPGPLVAVAAAVALGATFRSIPSLALTADQLVTIPITDSWRGYVTFPDFSALKSAAVYKTAIMIAVIASLETLLSVEATDKLDPIKRVTPTNRELKAQGVGNVISGLLGGLPVTQVIVRSSANVQAGGRSKASAVIHGVLLALSVAALPSTLNLIPLAALAAILLVVGYKLARPSLFRRVLDEGRGQSIPFAATVLGIIFTDLLVGISLGLGVATLGLLIQNFRLPHQIGHLPTERGGMLRLVLAQHVTFLNKASVLESLSAIPDGVKVEIDATESVYVHADVVELIDDFVEGAAERDIEVSVLGLEHHQKGGPGPSMTITVDPTHRPAGVSDPEGHAGDSAETSIRSLFTAADYRATTAEQPGIASSPADRHAADSSPPGPRTRA